jgi:hypothetical protein
MANVRFNSPAMLFRPFSAAREALASYRQESPAAYAVAEQVLGVALVLNGLLGSANPLRARRKSGVFGSLFTIAFGIIFIVVANLLGGLIHAEQFTGTTTGTVVDIQRSTYIDSDGKQQQDCALIARYSVNGQAYEVKDTNSSGGYKCKLQVGQSIELKYDPKNPQNYDTAQDLQVAGLFPLIFGGVGWLIAICGLFGFITKLAALILGIVLLLKGRRDARQVPAGGEMNTQEIKENVRAFFLQRLWGIR